MCILGIDPGITGGIAFFYPDENRIEAFDIPVVGHEVDVDKLATLIKPRAPKLGVIEKVHSMPKQDRVCR